MESRVTAVEMQVVRLEKDSKVLEDVVRDAKGNAEIIRNTETKVKLIEVLMANKNEAEAVGAPPGLNPIGKKSMKEAAAVKNFVKKSSPTPTPPLSRPTIPKSKPSAREVEEILSQVSVQKSYKALEVKVHPINSNSKIPKVDREEQHVKLVIAFELPEGTNRVAAVQVLRGWQVKLGIIDKVGRSSPFMNKAELIVPVSFKEEIIGVLKDNGCHIFPTEEQYDQGNQKYGSYNPDIKRTIINNAVCRIGHILANCNNFHIRNAILENLGPEGVSKKACLAKEDILRARWGKSSRDELQSVFQTRGGESARRA